MDELYICRTQYSTIYLDSCRYLNVHHRMIMVLYYVLISLFCLKPGEEIIFACFTSTKVYLQYFSENYVVQNLVSSGCLSNNKEQNKK